MIAMGFTKEECQTAMRAAFNNPERAIEYLLNVFYRVPS
jgi:UV excision repair protein RAD23